MIKTLSPAQLDDVLARARAFVGEPLQAIEFTAAELGFDIDFDFDTAFDAQPSRVANTSTPAATARCHGTRKISIRVPHTVLHAFQNQAKRKGTKPQTLINRVLKEQSKGW